MAVDHFLLQAIKTKFSRYSIDECEYAKRDIIETLKYHKDGSYADKLWAEMDEANARIAELNRSKPCPHCHGTGRVKP